MLVLLMTTLWLFGQNNYYVSNNGDDSNPGTIDNPWKTIQNAMDLAEPGNTVNIFAGTYNEKVYVNVSGTAGNFITFRNYNNDEVIIDGTGWNDPAMCEIYDQQYIRLQGLHFMNNIQPDAMGIFIEGMCSHIEIIECTISEIHFSADPNAPVNESTNAQPLIVYGTEAGFPITDLLVRDCEIHDARTGYSEALAINGNVDGFEISGNTVYNITNIGIDAIGHEGTCSNPDYDQARNGYIDWNTVYNCLSGYASAAGIYVDGARDIIIENNIVYNNQWGIEVGCENPGKTASGITVRNNFIYGNASGGLQLGGYDYPSGSGMVTDCMVVNNTLFNNATINHYDGELTLTYSENCTIVNNIFYADNPEAQLISLEDVEAVPPGLVMDYNLWYHPDDAENSNIYWNGADYESFNVFVTETGFETNAQFVNPLLKSDDIADPDLHLNEDSPAIGAANTAYLADAGERDIDDQNRVNDGLDKGADEYYQASGINDSRLSDNLVIFPNPAGSYIHIDTELSSRKPGEIRILDMNGKVILKEHVTHETIIPVMNLKPGLYFIESRLDAERALGKFIKQ